MKTALAIYALLAGIFAVVYVISVNVRMNARLRRFWDRPDTLDEWQRRFPSRRPEEIVQFLEALNEAFAFGRKRVYRFLPDDCLFEIYQALYPGETPGGSGDVWCFDLLLRSRLGLSSDELWNSDRTLSTIFEKTGTSD